MGDGFSAAVHRRRTVELPTGQKIEIEAIGLQDYAQVREQACAEYKRNLIQTYTKNLDLVPDKDRDGIVQKAFEKAEQITPDDLPTKTIKGPDGKDVTIGYADWWMGMTPPGAVYAVWLSMRRCPSQKNITLAEVEAMFENNAAALEETGEAIADLTKPRLGNSSPAAALEAGTTTKA